MMQTSMIRQTCPLCTIPVELLENIAFELVDQKFHGPPGSDFVNLLCTCDYVYQNLGLHNNFTFYAKILTRKFDITAGKRRGYHNFRSWDLMAQLAVYCHELQEIRRCVEANDYRDVQDIFAMAFIMMLDNDGKNRDQLVEAGLERMVNTYVRTRLWGGRVDVNGWPVEDEERSLALWLMWMLTTEETLLSETDAEREQIISLVLPYVIVNYRYATAQAPANHFAIPFGNADPNTEFPESLHTAHGSYPVYRDLRTIVVANSHYRTDSEFCIPPISTPAKLLYFARREIYKFGIPPHLALNRAQALAQGRTAIGPTQEDIHELNEYKSTKLPLVSGVDWWTRLSPDEWKEELGHGDVDTRVGMVRWKAPSAMWDHDWDRWTHCFDPRKRDWTPLCYTPGSMNGLWQGRMLIPDDESYQSLITMNHIPADFSEGYFRLTTVPMYMRLQEYHCVKPNKPVPTGGMNDGFDDGARNAWFPIGLRHNDMDDGCRIDSRDGPMYWYEKYEPGKPSTHDKDGCDDCKRDARRDAKARGERRRVVWERDERRMRRALKNSRAPPAPEGYEHLFESVGLRVDDADTDNDTMDLDEEEKEEDDGDRDYRGRDKCDGVADIILTGATDLRHGQSWNHFVFYGRVRRWDGLIGILRLSRDQHLGNIFLYGYLLGGQNFVGNWRMANSDMRAPAWECAFTMSKRDE